MIENVAIKIKGNRNKTCLSSSYKFTWKKINKKIILIIVINIDPKINWVSFFENIFFSTRGKKQNPIKDNNGSLKNNHIKI